jgi:hypothetical protein
MALRATRLLGVTIQDKGLPVLAWSALMLPVRGAEGGPNHLDLMRGLGRHQEVGLHVAAVEHMGVAVNNFWDTFITTIRLLVA